MITCMHQALSANNNLDREIDKKFNVMNRI